MNDSTAVQIGNCGEPRVFSLSEARALFPTVRNLTQSAYDELDPLRKKLEAMLPTDPALVRVEAEYEAVVKRWVGKMERLGLVIKGLWLVDFDTGDGYLCWKFPELRLGHYHGYDEGFTGRRPIQEVLDEQDPDWAHH
jgi:hypothetical protein